MANLIDAPSFTANEIYQISQQDNLEGAALGASFGGLGIDNQPHQQLANRTAWLYGQVTTLNSEVQAIQSVLQQSGTISSYSNSGGYTLYPNGAQYLVFPNDSFVFPAASPTGSFCLLATTDILYTVPGPLPSTINLGTINQSLQDISTDVFALNNIETLIACGNQGASGSIHQAGFFQVTGGYQAGQLIKLKYYIALTGAAYPFNTITITNASVQVMAIPY